MNTQVKTKPFELKGIHFKTGEPVVVEITNGRISRIIQGGTKENLPLIAPGLLDLQVNGYGGLDFNTLPLADGLVEKITTSLWGKGVTSYFPTVITNRDDLIEQALHSISEVCMTERNVGRGIAGIHLEGPFISPDDGPRGAHPKKYVKAPDWSLFQRWQEVAGGRIKIVTLSPEWPGAPEFISKCVESGVVVSIGHTSATGEQIQAAVDAGARMSTHLGNGAHPILPRHPNYIWEQLSRDSLWATVIADGFHLPKSALKVILRVKGERVMLVSDAVSLSGMPPGQYDLHIGGKVVLTPEGKLHLADHPNLLAGSALTLIHGIEHLVKSGLASLSEAWEMASVRPSRLIGLPAKDGLKAGIPADLVVFSPNGWKIDILETYKDGVLVYSKNKK